LSPRDKTSRFFALEERGVSFRLTTIHLSLLSAAFILGRIRARANMHVRF